MCRKTEKVESKKEIAADDEGGLGSMAAAVGSFFVFISLFFSAVGSFFCFYLYFFLKCSGLI